MGYIIFQQVNERFYSVVALLNLRATTPPQYKRLICRAIARNDINVLQKIIG